MDKKLKQMAREWTRIASAYRAAQREHEPSSKSWQANKELAELAERIASDLSALGAPKRSGDNSIRA